MAKVKYGLKNVHYVVPTVKADGSLDYTSKTVKALPGAVNLSLDPAGNKMTFYADDTAFFEAGGSMGYTGTLELALVPDEFRKDCLGEIEDNNGALIEDANFSPVPFSLMFEFTNDVNATRYIMYKCTAARPQIAGQTKGEDTTVSTETLNLTITPVLEPTSGKQIVRAKADASVTGYANWYTTPYQMA